MKRRSYTGKCTEPTLYCDNTNCDNVSSKLRYVEEKVVEGLKKWLEQYHFEYQEQVERLNCDRIKALEDTIVSLEVDAKKEKDKLLNICNLLEDGTYTKEIFNARSNMVLQNVEKINLSIKEYKTKLQQEKKVERKKEVLVPTIKNLIDVYDLLQTAEEKNNLLKSVLTQITYIKTEKAIKKNSDPTNFTINLYPKIKKSAV